MVRSLPLAHRRFTSELIPRHLTAVVAQDTDYSVSKRFLHGINGAWQVAPAAIRDSSPSIAMLTPTTAGPLDMPGRLCSAAAASGSTTPPCDRIGLMRLIAPP